jgi:LmbE family N-acetylglucosaminyl deacetylase
MPSPLRVVVLAPHPDDFDAIGATMRFFRDNGNLIEVAVVTSGASGVEEGFHGALTSDSKGALRENEQRASCKFFGLPEGRLIFLRLAEEDDGHPLEDAANFENVRSYLLSKRPDLVFLPHGNDSNRGHRRTYSLFRQCMEKDNLPLVSCLNRDPKTIAMRNDLLMVYNTDVGIWKAELLRFHQSQHSRNLNTRGYGFDERILNSNRQIAQEIGISGEYVESFELECYGAASLTE